ncbi:galactose-binding domain-like protein, partial [Entophlyctis helioformis]
MVVPPENIALASNGAKLALATSEHPKHPPDCILDGNLKTFWISTGLYPQEFVVSFPAPVSISKIIVSSMKVAHWNIEACKTDKPLQFESISDQSLEDTDNVLQTHAVSPQDPLVARHLRFEATRGYSPFISVHRLVVYGELSDASAKNVPAAAES